MGVHRYFAELHLKVAAEAELAGRTDDAQRELAEAMEYDSRPDFQIDHEAVRRDVARVVASEKRRVVLSYLVPILRHLWRWRCRAQRWLPLPE
jgi:hypothetical protein